MAGTAILPASGLRLTHLVTSVNVSTALTNHKGWGQISTFMTRNRIFGHALNWEGYKMTNIPVMHCFDDNYCLPASVAFYSMLEHASKDHAYDLYVLHTDISEENQYLLRKTIEKFKNAHLSFINMTDYTNGGVDNIWEKTSQKGPYSK